VNENTERLTAYAAKLAAAGFRVWLTPMAGRSGGFLTYERGGFYGHLQLSEWDGWQHDMPIVPSREFGSSMFIEQPLDPWTVEAAEQAAQEWNTNSAVGRQRNAGSRTWLSSSAQEVK
jgi:hypothetical protein